MQTHRRHKARVLALLLAPILLVSGCWDRREIEDIAFVTMLGLDKGAENRIKATIQIAIPRVLGGPQAQGDGGGETPSAIVEQLEGDTLTEVLRTAETFTNRRVSFIHVKAIVFGRELAEEGLLPHIGVLTRNRQFRRTIQVQVADGKAGDLLTLRPNLEREPALYIEDLTRRAKEATARAPRTDLHDLLTRMEARSVEAVAPLLTRRPNTVGLEQAPEFAKPMLWGTAVFRGDKMVGVLSGTETESYLVLTGETNRFIETIPAVGKPDRRIAVEMVGEKRVIRLRLDRSVPSFEVHLNLDGELRQLEHGPKENLGPEYIRILEERLAKGIEEKSRRLLKRLQEDHEADVIGFGHIVRMRFLDWPTWESYHWHEKFPEARISVTAKVSIRKTGMTFQQFKPSK